MTTDLVRPLHHYSLGPVKQWVQNAGDFLGSMFGIKTEYGWRQSDPFPDHPSGHAVDFMITSKSTGDALANYAVANADNLGVKYVIWNRRVWTRTQGWHAYTATTNPHTDHVHVTFLDSPGPWTAQPVSSPVSLNTAGEAGSVTCAWSLRFPVSGDTCILTKTHARALLGGSLMVGGGVVFIIGIALLMAYGLGQTKAAALLPSTLRRFT